MVDPRNKSLRPPIRRSWLRLRLGKAYYTGRRYLLWCSPRFHWAKRRQAERLPHVQASHATPLLRKLRGEEMELQRNKVLNLCLAVDSAGRSCACTGRDLQLLETHRPPYPP